MKPLNVTVKRTVLGEGIWSEVATGTWHPPGKPTLRGKIPDRVFNALFSLGPDQKPPNRSEINDEQYHYEMVCAED
jgi:hypothetical protein